MSIHIPSDQFLVDEQVDLNAQAIPAPTRSFDLPVHLHVLTLTAYLVYLAIMSAAFGGGENAIPMVICMITVAAAFIVPGLWSTMKGAFPGKAARWDDFCEHGVDTMTGRVKAFDASVQVLILPVLILGWGSILAIYGKSLTS